MLGRHLRPEVVRHVSQKVRTQLVALTGRGRTERRESVRNPRLVSQVLLEPILGVRHLQSRRQSPARPSARPTATFLALRTTRLGLAEAAALRETTPDASPREVAAQAQVPAAPKLITVASRARKESDGDQACSQSSRGRPVDVHVADPLKGSAYLLLPT